MGPAAATATATAATAAAATTGRERRSDGRAGRRRRRRQPQGEKLACSPLWVAEPGLTSPGGGGGGDDGTGATGDERRRDGRGGATGRWADADVGDLTAPSGAAGAPAEAGRARRIRSRWLSRSGRGTTTTTTTQRNENNNIRIYGARRRRRPAHRRSPAEDGERAASISCHACLVSACAASLACHARGALCGFPWVGGSVDEQREQRL